MHAIPERVRGVFTTRHYTIHIYLYLYLYKSNYPYVVFFASAKEFVAEAMCLLVVHVASVRPLTPILCAAIYLYLVKGFQQNLAQIFVM